MKKKIIIYILVSFVLFFSSCEIFEPKITLSQMIESLTQQYGEPDYQEYSSYSSDTYRLKWYFDDHNHCVTLWEYKGSWDILSEYDSFTFDQVSKLYRDSKGEPEEVETFTSGNYETIDWWYWSQGFEVSFINSPYDDVIGWRVENIYTFSPIH